MPHILIVEDEPKLASLLTDYLKSNSYTTTWLDHGEEAVETIRQQSFDLILLDLMLPGKDGLDICREVRQFSQVPIIMLTARVEEIDRLLGLELGADDYICKPFSPREVVARVKAILRRAPPALMTTTQTRVEASVTATPTSSLQIDTERHEAKFEGQTLDLTPVEFRLLNTFAASPGRIFSREQLLDHIYDDHRVVTDRTVDSHIKNLRRKLEAIKAGDTIRSIYGVGYKLEI